MTPANIYKAVLAGTEIPHRDLDPAFKHYTQLATMLAATGPAFAAAQKEADWVAGVLQLHIAACKYCSAQEDRTSDSYHEGYRTGIVWDSHKDNYRPGGPWVMTIKEHESPTSEWVAKCLASQVHARRWLMGFDEGLGAQRAGRKPTPDMLCCGTEAGPLHRHWLTCLVGREVDPKRAAA